MSEQDISTQFRGEIESLIKQLQAALAALEQALNALHGQPALVIVNAGEVNAGEFDPVKDMITLARQHNCWVHVDGAFGLFARISPRTAHFADGVEQADSVTVDGHKWLNVPFDSGYAFVRDHGLLTRAFRYSADYLPTADNPRPTLGAGGLSEEQLDDLNQKLGEAVLADGRFMAGTSKIGARTIFRPAFSNWRTRDRDVEEFADVVVELGQTLS